jgi:hypothetical protein
MTFYRVPFEPPRDRPLHLPVLVRALFQAQVGHGTDRSTDKSPVPPPTRAPTPHPREHRATVATRMNTTYETAKVRVFLLSRQRIAFATEIAQWLVQCGPECSSVHSSAGPVPVPTRVYRQVLRYRQRPFLLNAALIHGSTERR